MKKIAFRPYLLIFWAAVLVVASAAAIEPVTLLAIAVVVTPIILLLSFLWPARWEIRHPLFRNRVAVPLALALATSVLCTQWPVRLHFLLARPALDSLANIVVRGQKAEMPARAALFTIRKAEVSRDGIVCLWIDLDHRGRAWFVKTSPDSVQFNLWSMVS